MRLLPLSVLGSTSVVGVIVLLVPGQGSQTPGMLVPWLDLPGAAGDLATWSDACGLDLLHLGTAAGADEIRDTAVAQPLLTATALLSARALDVTPDMVCGHSIGELAALAVAGVLDDTSAVRLAAERGRAMAVAAASQPTGMAAVLGGDADEVLAAAVVHGLEVATVNVAGQVVLGGPLDALDALAAAPPASARVRRLETAGAFHTSAMSSAVPRLSELVAATTPGWPVCAVVANADGAIVTDGRELLDRLVGQLTGPVRFDLCLQTIAGRSPSLVIELAPGGTLAAVAKRALPGVPIVALKTPADIPTSVTA
ncbi:MAG: malonyl CoA-acyl carrier protein transacylase [Frankiales bacterium]|nr:malonyl CoA-acyl carrier protein transacylase [Frankiales bacterium]